MRLVLVFVLLFGSFMAPKLVADGGKIPVKVTYVNESENPISGRLGYYIENELAKSSLLKSRSDDEAFFLVVSLVSLDHDNQAIYSVSISYVINAKTALIRLFLTHIAGRCGSKALETCASSIISDTYDASKNMGDELRNAVAWGGEVTEIVRTSN